MIEAIYQDAEKIALARNGEIINRLLRRRKQYHPERRPEVYACPYMSHRWDEYSLECQMAQLTEDEVIGSWASIRIERELRQLQGKEALLPLPCGKCTLCIECFGPFVKVAALTVARGYRVKMPPLDVSARSPAFARSLASHARRRRRKHLVINPETWNPEEVDYE